MTTTSPFPRAVEAAQSYRRRVGPRLRQSQTAALDEVDARLQRLDAEYAELVSLNSLLLAQDGQGLVMHRNPVSGEVTVRFGSAGPGFTLQPADPAVPIELDSHSRVGGYLPGSSSADGAETPGYKRRMEELLEAFYSGAHRIQKLMREVLGKPHKGSMGITTVRNHLVEHPSTGSLYSFGYSTNGPVVKPIQRGQPEWIDAGLFANAEEFVTSLETAFGGAMH